MRTNRTPNTTGYDPYRLTSALQNRMPFILSGTWAVWPMGSQAGWEYVVNLTNLTLDVSLRTFRSVCMDHITCFPTLDRSTQRKNEN